MGDLQGWGWLSPCFCSAPSSVGPPKAEALGRFPGRAMILSAAPQSGRFREGRFNPTIGLLFAPVQFFGRVFFLRSPTPPAAPGPRLSRPAVFLVGIPPTPSLVPESTVARDPGCTSTRHWSWIPCPGDPPSPCPCGCERGGDRLGFPGVAKPHRRDGYRRPGYSFGPPLLAQMEGWYTCVLRGCKAHSPE